MSIRSRRAACGIRSSTATRSARRRSCRRTSSWTARSATPSTTCTCSRRWIRATATCSAIPNACQPPYSLDTNVPDMNVAGWVLNGASPIRDYVDPQWQMVANAGWTKGSHNVKFGIDYIILYQDHYETQAQAFAFDGGVTMLPGGAAANNFNRFASFLLGMPSSRTAQVMTPLHRRRCIGRTPPELGIAERVPAEHVAQQQRRHLHSRSVEPDVEDHRVGRSALGVLLAAAPRRSRHRGVRLRHRTGC